MTATYVNTSGEKEVYGIRKTKANDRRRHRLNSKGDGLQLDLGGVNKKLANTQGEYAMYWYNKKNNKTMPSLNQIEEGLINCFKYEGELEL